MTLRVSGLGLVLVALAVYAAGQVPPATTAPAAPAALAVSPEQAVEEARQLREARRYSDAVDVLKNVLKNVPTHTGANLLAGDVLIDLKDFDSARVHYMKVLELEPSNFRANMGIGKIWIANRVPRQAASYLEQAEAVAPPDGRAEVKHLLASTYAQMGQVPRAIEKAQEAVQADPDDLDALQSLVEIRQAAAARDVQQVAPATADAEKYVQKAVEAARQEPWERDSLTRVSHAFDLRIAALQAYHNSFYKRDYRNQPTDELLPGKGPDAAAVLVRSADAMREQALLRLVLAEHDALLLAETAVKPTYDPKNPKYIEFLAASCQQLQDLTARLLGAAALANKKLNERVAESCRKVLEVDPQSEAARRLLEAVGGSLTTQPTATP